MSVIKSDDTYFGKQREWQFQICTKFLKAT